LGNLYHNTKEPFLKRSTWLRSAALQLHTSGFSMTGTSRLAAFYILMAFTASEAAPALADGTIEFAYGGRITEANGKPVEGDVALKVAFFHDNDGQTEILAVTKA